MANRDKIEKLQQEIAELENAHRDREGDKATIDTRANADSLMDMQKQIDTLKADAEKRPAQWGDAHDYEGQEQKITGKYAKKRKRDLALATYFMNKAHAKDSDASIAPSDALLKVMSSGGAGTGQELLEEATLPALWEDIHLESRVLSNLPQISLPSDPFKLPLGLGGATWRKGVPSVGTSATDLVTAEKTMTVTEQIAEVQLNYNLSEDAIVAVMGEVQKTLARGGREQMDKFFMRADATASATGNINLDDDTPASSAFYLTNGEDGIIHQYIVDNTAMGVDASNAAITLTLVNNARQLMGKYAIDPTDAMIFAEPVTYLTMLDISQVTTAEKYGAGATVLTGELARIAGMPIVVTEAVPQTEADGKQSVTAGNNDRGALAIVNRSMWKVGFLRDLMIEVAQDIQNRKWILVASMRLAIVNHGTRSSNTHTAGVFNIAL